MAWIRSLVDYIQFYHERSQSGRISRHGNATIHHQATLDFLVISEKTNQPCLIIKGSVNCEHQHRQSELSSICSHSFQTEFCVFYILFIYLLTLKSLYFSFHKFPYHHEVFQNGRQSLYSNHSLNGSLQLLINIQCLT